MIPLKTPSEIEIMAEGGQILKRILKKLIAAARPGVTTGELDKLVRQLTREAGGQPSFLNYRPEGAKNPYPAAICTSINQVIVHGLPGVYQLQEGDLLKIDIGLFYKNFHTDTAVTVGIGKISPQGQRLLEVTKQALHQGIAQCRPGKHLGDIGFAIEQTMTKAGFQVARSLTGHGIGQELHQEPTVSNFGQRGQGELLKIGMVLALEPMVCFGSGQIRQLKDESYASQDNSLTAHFEETVAITESGPRVLTD